jgi:hypothetical protein
MGGGQGAGGQNRGLGDETDACCAWGVCCLCSGYVEESCACVEHLPHDALGHVLAFLHAQEVPPLGHRNHSSNPALNPSFRLCCAALQAEQLFCSSRALRGCGGEALVSTFSMTRALCPAPLPPSPPSAFPAPAPPCTRINTLLSAQQAGLRRLCVYGGMRRLELDLSLLSHRDILALAKQVGPPPLLLSPTSLFNL